MSDMGVVCCACGKEFSISWAFHGQGPHRCRDCGGKHHIWGRPNEFKIQECRICYQRRHVSQDEVGICG